MQAAGAKAYLRHLAGGGESTGRRRTRGDLLQARRRTGGGRMGVESAGEEEYNGAGRSSGVRET